MTILATVLTPLPMVDIELFTSASLLAADKYASTRDERSMSCGFVNLVTLRFILLSTMFLTLTSATVDYKDDLSVVQL